MVFFHKGLQISEKVKVDPESVARRRGYHAGYLRNDSDQVREDLAINNLPPTWRYPPSDSFFEAFKIHTELDIRNIEIQDIENAGSGVTPTIKNQPYTKNPMKMRQPKVKGIVVENRVPGMYVPSIHLDDKVNKIIAARDTVNNADIGLAMGTVPIQTVIASMLRNYDPTDTATTISQSGNIIVSESSILNDYYLPDVISRYPNIEDSDSNRKALHDYIERALTEFRAIPTIDSRNTTTTTNSQSRYMDLMTGNEDGYVDFLTGPDNL